MLHGLFLLLLDHPAQKRLLLLGTRLVVEPARLNHLAVDVQLLVCPLEDHLLNRVLRDQPVDPHLVLLANPVGPVLGLEILVRVPVRVENHNCVRSLQVEPQTTGPGREQEAEVLRVRCIEQLEHRLAVVGLRCAVQPEVLDPAEPQEVLHDVHDLRHLEEKQRAVVGGLELRQDAV